MLIYHFKESVKLWIRDKAKENGVCARGNTLWEGNWEIYKGNYWKMRVILVGWFVLIQFGINSPSLGIKMFSSSWGGGAPIFPRKHCF